FLIPFHEQFVIRMELVQLFCGQFYSLFLQRLLENSRIHWLFSSSINLPYGQYSPAQYIRAVLIYLPGLLRKSATLGRRIEGGFFSAFPLPRWLGQEWHHNQYLQESFCPPFLASVPLVPSPF